MLDYLIFGFVILALAYMVRLYLLYKDIRKYGSSISLVKAKGGMVVFSKNKKMFNSLDVFSEDRKPIASIQRTERKFVLKIPDAATDRELEILKIAGVELDKTVTKGGRISLEYPEFQRMTEIIFDELERRKEKVRLRWNHNAISGKS